MKYCIFCGSQLDDEAIFCGTCGKRNVKEAENVAQDNNPQMSPQYMNGAQGNQQPGGYGQMSPQGNQQPGGYGQMSPQGNQQPGGYGQMSPQGYQQPGGYGQMSPQGYQQPGGYGQMSPQGYQQPGGYGQMSPQGNQQQGGYGQMSPQGYQQPASNTEVNSQPAGNGEKNGSRNKKKSVIAGIIVIVLALIVAAVLIFKKSSGKNGPIKAALDNYFKAIENLDFRALDKVCYPEDSFIIEKAGLTYKFPDSEGRWIMEVLYNTPALSVAQWILSNDRMKDIKVQDLICASYGMDPYAKGGMEQMREALNNIDSFKTVFGKPAIKYEIVDTLDADEFNGVTFKDGKMINTAPVEWMEKNLNRYGDGQFIDSTDPNYLKVEDVKAVFLKIEWSYRGKKYGYDKSWWDNDDFIKKMDEAQNGKPFDAMLLKKGKSVKMDFTDYDSVINYHDNNVYNLVLYKTDGKWYVYPESLRRLLNPFIDY